MDYPKVMLNLHLDGAMPKSLFVSFSKEMGYLKDMSDEEWISSHVIKESAPLEKCLESFDLFLKLLQTKEHLSKCSEELFEECYNDGIRLLEVRFAPQLHTSSLTMEEATLAVCEGMHKTLNKHKDMVGGIILCMMHGDHNDDLNTQTVLLANKLKNEGVVGIDLAGNELANPLSDYKAQFDLAQKLNVNITVHAGENAPTCNVYYIASLGIKRIGHGIHASQDIAVTNYLKEHNVTLEISPTSNLLAKGVNSLKEHPIRYFLEQGIPLNINTDDPLLTASYLDDEYKMLEEIHHFNETEFIYTNLCGANASFCKDKDIIIKQLEEAYKNIKESI